MSTDRTTKLLDKAHALEQRARKNRRVARDAAISGRTHDARVYLCAAQFAEQEADRIRNTAADAEAGLEVDFHADYAVRLEEVLP